LLGPAGENLHLTVRSAWWWEEQFAPYFELQLYEGFYDQQVLIVGTRRPDLAAAGRPELDAATGVAGPRPAREAVSARARR
jgi:hypothetical protein